MFNFFVNKISNSLNPSTSRNKPSAEVLRKARIQFEEDDVRRDLEEDEVDRRNELERMERGY